MKDIVERMDRYLGEGWGKDYLVGGAGGSVSGSMKRKRTRKSIEQVKETLSDLHDKKSNTEDPGQKDRISKQIAREQGKLESLRNTLKSQNKAF